MRNKHICECHKHKYLIHMNSQCALKDKNDVLIKDEKEIAEILSAQYRTMFSTPATNIANQGLIEFFKQPPMFVGMCGPTGGRGGALLHNQMSNKA